MFSRYSKRDVAFNNNKLYNTFFRNRGVNFIRQYVTPNMKYLTVEEMSKLDSIGVSWKSGDRFYKLAHKYYGNSKMWWIIAWYNKKPTESHVAMGETIYIPLPLDKVLELMDIQ